MGKTYRAYQPEQALRLPPDLRDWVPAEHLVWFVADLVDTLDRTAEAGEPEEEAQKAKPQDKDQYNFRDPESRIMKAGGGFEQAYNAQAAVEQTKRNAEPVAAPRGRPPAGSGSGLSPRPGYARIGELILGRTPRRVGAAP